MKIFTTLVQILLSLAIIALVFLQSNGDTEGRNNILSSSNFEKRGWEKIVYYLTLFVLFAFLLSSLIQTII